MLQCIFLVAFSTHASWISQDCFSFSGCDHFCPCFVLTLHACACSQKSSKHGKCVIKILMPIINFDAGQTSSAVPQLVFSCSLNSWPLSTMEQLSHNRRFLLRLAYATACLIYIETCYIDLLHRLAATSVFSVLQSRLPVLPISNWLRPDLSTDSTSCKAMHATWLLTVLRVFIRQICNTPLP